MSFSSFLLRLDLFQCFVSSTRLRKMAEDLQPVSKALSFPSFLPDVESYDG